MAGRDLDSVIQKVNQLGLGDYHVEKYCYRQSPTNEFTKGDIFCELDVNINVATVSQSTAVTVSNKVSHSLTTSGFILEPINNTGQDNIVGIAAYSFKDRGMPCIYSADYYGAAVSSDSRPSGVPESGEALNVSIGCSMAANRNFFPARD